MLVTGAANAQGVSHDTSRDARAQQNQPDPKAKPQPSDLSAIKDQIHSVATALEAANNKQETAEEKDQAKRNLAAQEKIAGWTPWLFALGLVEIIVTIMGVIFVWRTLTETRRIGQAQVRAYVNIKTAKIYFWTLDAHPVVEFLAFNSGQSPARNFVWNITLQYAGPPGRMTELSEKWTEQNGVDIPAASESPPNSAIIPNMSAIKYVQDPIPGVVLTMVRARIDFRFTDVFDKDWFGETYFGGTMRKREVTPEEERQSFTGWEGGLLVMAKPNDWGTIAENEKT